MSDAVDEFKSEVGRQGLIAILRTADPSAAKHQLTDLLSAGVAVAEVSLTTPGAMDVVAELTARHPGAWLGVGTVTEEAQVREAVEAGARFLVAPTVSEAVIATATRMGIPIVPGAATPTEAMHAWDLGATLVKLFPASLYGPDGVGDVLSALPQLPLVPTGGITLAEAPEYLARGAVAVGLGSALRNGASGDLASDVHDLLTALAGAR